MSSRKSLSATKPSVRPSRKPEDLADLVATLPAQQQAEIMYDLICHAATAAEDSGNAELLEFLAELENLAEVYTDPAKRRALQKEVSDEVAERASAAAPASPASGTP